MKMLRRRIAGFICRFGGARHGAGPPSQLLFEPGRFMGSAASPDSIASFPGRVQVYAASLTAGDAASIDTKWARLASLSDEYQSASCKEAVGAAALERTRLQLWSAFLTFWDVIWKEAKEIYGVETMTTAEFWRNPATGTAPPTSLVAFRARVLQSVVSAWYGAALALAVPLPVASHACVVRLAALRSLAGAKLAANAVSLFGVAPGAEVLGVVLEACVRHRSPSQAWPYLVALSARGLKPHDEVLDALVEQGERLAQLQAASQSGHLRMVRDLSGALDPEIEQGDEGAAGEGKSGATTQQGMGRRRSRGSRARAAMRGSPSDPAARDSSARDDESGLDLPPLSRDPGVSALLQHSLGLQAESVRGSIAELKVMNAVFGGSASQGKSPGRQSGTVGSSLLGAGTANEEGNPPTSSPPRSSSAGPSRDDLLAMAVSAVNSAYGMPVEPAVPGAAADASGTATSSNSELDGVFSIPPLGPQSPEVAIMALLQEEEDDDDDIDDEGEEGEDDQDGDDDDDEDDDGLELEGEEEDDDDVYARLGAEAQIVRAALFGNSTSSPSSAAATHTPQSRDSETPPPSSGQVGGPPTALVPGWVLHALAAETARRELASSHLLPHMRATAGGVSMAHAAPAPVPTLHGALEDRLAFVARHSVLHLMPDSPPVQAAVTRWQVALVGLARQAAAATAQPPSSPGTVNESHHHRGGKRYVSIPYLQLLTDPLCDPRQPGSLLRAQHNQQTDEETGLDDVQKKERLTFCSLHPLWKASPDSGGSRQQMDLAARHAVARGLARVYLSLVVDATEDGG